MENEMLKELERLQEKLNDERVFLHNTFDFRLNTLENQIIRLRRKIELEQEKMGAALATENKGGD